MFAIERGGKYMSRQSMRKCTISRSFERSVQRVQIFDCISVMIILKLAMLDTLDALLSRTARRDARSAGGKMRLGLGLG